ncbi:SIMPL domain-containing protein [Craterilacuibacter sp.]|uniref:SIMPL domain-containing protein n=1 Tax=Craterilacuibacter sp. TaxID=2870909 RepID=UPI003F3D2A69
MKTLLCTLALLCSAMPPALAEGISLNLSASAERELPNDELVAQLYTEEKAGSPGALAEQLNRQLARALSASKDFPTIQTRNSGYSSWPSYDKAGKIQGWSGRATIQLQSRNMAQAGELISRLQRFMLLANMDFRVSSAARREAEQQLIPQAITDLRTQAKIAAQALGKNTIAVRELNLGQSAPPPSFRSFAASSASMNAEAKQSINPDWQAGQSLLRLEVTGKVELL